MNKYIIEGGKRLKGVLKVSGAKNSALPILIGTLLTDKRCNISNVPQLEDIKTINALLSFLNKDCRQTGDKVSVSCSGKFNVRAPYELVKRMRASVLVMGPLLVRCGKAKVSLPGGCAIGARPINLHLDAFKKMGAKVKLEQGYLNIRCKRLKGERIYLDYPSVGATENIMMAACLAKGVTYIENAACEPEIVDLANFLRVMGARITGMGTKEIIIRGVDSLGGVRHFSVLPDRIEAATYMLAAALTGGCVELQGIKTKFLEAVTDKLDSISVKVNETKKGIKVESSGHLLPCDIETLPYPGFPTDLQAPWAVLMSMASGTSLVTETVFENRFQYIGDLKRMGANIQIKGNSIMITGVKKLEGAPVMATDLRGGAALVLAGLVAHGRTEVSRIYHVKRGYENMPEKLKLLGARIREVNA